VTQDDLLCRFRLRVLAIAAELGNVCAGCRAMGMHPCTYYRWKRQLDRHGPEILRPRERRVPRMANQTRVLVEQRVVAFALGHPGFGRPGSPPSSPGPRGWDRAVDQRGLAGAARPRPEHPRQALRAGRWRCGATGATATEPAPERHLDVDHPGQLVQLDCFASAGCRGPRGPCGRTPPSTWPRPTPGPPCR
jgi:hypothetical protein